MPEYVHEEEIIGKPFDWKLTMRMVRFLAPYKPMVLLSFFMLLTWTLSSMFLPILMKIAIDDKIKTGDLTGLMYICLAYIGLLLFKVVAQYFQVLIMSNIGQYMMRDMRNAIFTKLQALQMTYYDKNPVGRIFTRLTSDVDSVFEFITEGVITVIADIIIIGGTIGFIFFLDWRLALVTVALFPVMIAQGWIFQYLATKFYRNARIKQAKVNAFLNENIMGMRTIQWSNRQKVNKGMFLKINSDMFSAQLKSMLNFTVFMNGIDFTQTIALILLVYVGSKLILAGTVMVGTVMAFGTYLQNFYGSMHDISEHYNTFQTAMVGAERVTELLDHPVTITDRPGARVIDEKLKGRVEFKNVTFSYDGKVDVLKDVSFTVEPGQTVAIVGPTGAGKTSIISLISRLYDIQKGDITIDGISIFDMKLESLRKQISVVLQDPFIFSGPVIENIKLLSPIPDEKAIEAAKIVGADDFIERLPDCYQHMLSERGSTLSVGQRQLLSFARAIAHDPAILVLDEATSSIDTASEQLIQEALTKLIKNRTSIVIAHRLSTIKNADKVLVISGGKIVEQGKHDELLAMGGLYRNLYELQYKGQENSK
jgi:ATP-binding cassette subfamily B protein